MEWTNFPRGITHPGTLERCDARDLTDLADQLKALPVDAAWSAATFDPPHRRAANVALVHALVFDVDGKNGLAGTMADAQRAFEGVGLLLHTTKSNTPAAPCFRIVVLPTRPLARSEFASAWHCCADRLQEQNVRVDAAARDAGRAWYAPPPGADVIVVNGPALEVGALLVPRTNRPPTLERAIERMRKTKHGRRNDTLFRLVVQLRPQVDAGELEREVVSARLADAARSTGLEEDEITRTIENGFEGPTNRLPRIVISGDYAHVIDETVKSLSEIDNLFRRGGSLVEVPPRDRVSGAVHARPMTVPGLRYAISRVREYVRISPRTGARTVWPPDEVINGVLDRGPRLEIPELVAVVESPTIDGDGRIILTHGYDLATGLFVCADNITLDLGTDTSPEDARAAYDDLADLFADFPFAQPAQDIATVVAAIVTAVCRACFPGPAPVIVVSANVRGVGKTLLSELIGLIATGRPIAMMSLPPSDEEAAKSIGAFVREASSIVVFDNIDGEVCLPSLDSLVTAETYRVRELGANRLIEGRNRFLFILNGNGLCLGGDMSRRALPIEIQSAEEAPELRNGFRYPDIRAHVRAHRGHYVGCALRIVRAHYAAGLPRCGITPLGSYEPWSERIAAPIAFASGVDVIAARSGRSVVADRDAETLEILLDIVGMRASKTATVGQLLDVAAPPDGSRGDTLLAATLDEIAGSPGGRINTKRLGRFLARYERRVVGGRRFVGDGRGHNGLRKWRVETVRDENPPTNHSDGGLVGFPSTDASDERDDGWFPSTDASDEPDDQQVGDET